MIHYTLLPEEEMKSLKREYHTRLFIFTLFFISLAIILGILSLIPAFVIAYTDEKSALNRIEEIRKNRDTKEIESIKKELQKTTEYIKKIDSAENNIKYSEIIPQIINDKNANIQITSLSFIRSDKNATSTNPLVLQGIAKSRDSLLKFKSELEKNSLISSVELPVSDLARSKDIDFSIKISLIKIK